MDDLLNRLRKVNEANDRGSSEYNSTDVDLSVDMNVDDVEVIAPDKLHLDYGFNLDWRTWGIKDIEIELNVDPQFDVTVDGESIEITVPVASINISWTPGKHYIPSILSVVIDRTGKVNSAELVVYYIEH